MKTSLKTAKVGKGASPFGICIGAIANSFLKFCQIVFFGILSSMIVLIHGHSLGAESKPPEKKIAALESVKIPTPGNSLSNAMRFDDTPPWNKVIPIGQDQIPCSVSRIDKTDEAETLADWLGKNFVTDKTAADYYLPETVTDVIVDGYDGIAFKTWNLLNFSQNILIEKDNAFILFTTPDGDFNPNGNVVFEALLGLKLPETQSPPVFGNNISDVEFQYSLAASACTNRCSQNIKIGECSGIPVFSNGEYTGGGGTCGTNKVNGYTTGYKWQCVELANRFFFLRFGKKIAGGNANTYYSAASSKGLNRASNGGTDNPRAGNLICSAGGSYGHIGVIKEVGKDYIIVAHQNWSCPNGEIKLSMKVTTKNGKKYYTVSGFSSSYPIQGWLWPK